MGLYCQHTFSTIKVGHVFVSFVATAAVDIRAGGAIQSPIWSFGNQGRTLSCCRVGTRLLFMHSSSWSPRGSLSNRLDPKVCCPCLHHTCLQVVQKSVPCRQNKEWCETLEFEKTNIGIALAIVTAMRRKHKKRKAYFANEKDPPLNRISPAKTLMPFSVFKFFRIATSASRSRTRSYQHENEIGITGTARPQI